jgi:hypothetical protein
MSVTLLTRRTIKPSGCVMAFGVPTDRGGFERALRNNKAEYAKLSLGGWPQYEDGAVNPITRLITMLSKWGVRIVQDLSLLQFIALCTGEFDTIILIFT